MGVIDTNTTVPQFQYSTQPYIDRPMNLPGESSHQRLWTVLKSSTANTFEFWRSLDNGVNWSMRGSLTRSNIQEWSGIWADRYGFHWLYRTNDSNQDRIYHRYFEYESETISGEQQIDAISNGGTPGLVFSGIDFAVVNDFGRQRTHVGIAVGTNIGGDISVSCYDMNGEFYDAQGATIGYLGGFHAEGGTGRVTPSVDIDHDGTDGKNSAAAHLWVVFGRASLHLLKFPYSSTGGWEPVSSHINLDDLGGFPQPHALGTARFDGTRLLMATAWDSSGKAGVIERNKANTSHVKRITPTNHPAGAITHVTCSYNSTSKDFRVYAVGTSNDDLYYIEYTRASNTWGSWTLVSSTDVTSGGADFSVRRSNYGNSRYDVLTNHTNQQLHTSHLYNAAPSAPTWVSPVNGEAQNSSASLLLDWQFNDQDPFDTQSAYALSRQIGAGSLNYWRASDSTWQATEQKNTTGTTSVTLSSGWSTHTDAAYTYKVKTWDSQDLAGVYSAGMVVIPSQQVNPTVTSPTAAQVVGSGRLSVAWTVSEQTQYRIKIINNPDNGTVHIDTGWVANSSARSAVPAFDLPDGAALTVQLQTKNNEGLAGATQSVNFTVDYVEPSVPSYTVTPITASGVIRLVITNPSAGVTTFVGEGTAVTGNNASLQPTVPASVAKEDLLVIVASIRNSGTGTVNLPTGWTSILNFGNVRIMGRYAQLDADDAPTVTFASGAAGDDTLAHMAAWRGAGILASATATQLNGSAQNIAYPGLTVPINNQLVIATGWKQDDWTVPGATTPATMTEIEEWVSTAGNDAGMVWDYVIQTTAANISSGSWTITGGLSAISRALLVSMNVKPTFLTQEIWRRVVGDSSDGLRIATGVATGATYDDFTAVHGVNYEYRVKVTGTNGTSIFGAWTA